MTRSTVPRNPVATRSGRLGKAVFTETFTTMSDDFRQLGPFDFNAYAGGMRDRMNDGVARIESVKLRLLGNPAMSEFERADLIGELNSLRAAYLHLCTLASRQEGSSEDAASRPAPADLEFDGILGSNSRILENLERIRRLARSRLTILLEGETGCGKEMFSRIVHLNSKRTKFVAVNCGALPSNLIESELFGHVRGAFTGAVGDRKGRFEEADGGTIFLDEIGEMEPLAQVKLLRALDVGEVQRVGSDRTIRVDVRVVAATNRNLERMVAEGRFREDLFFRLNICHLTIPPLRERRDEIPPLMDFFIDQARAGADLPRPRLDPELTRFLREVYPFPGNIRELRNIAMYITNIYNGDPVTLDLLPERYSRALLTAPDGASTAARHAVIEQAERNHLIDMLTKYRGDVPGVGKAMGLSRGRLYQLFKKHDLAPAVFRHPRGAEAAEMRSPSREEA